MPPRREAASEPAKANDATANLGFKYNLFQKTSAMLAAEIEARQISNYTSSIKDCIAPITECSMTYMM